MTTRQLTLSPGAVRFSGSGIGDRQAIILVTNQTLDSMDEIVMTSGAKTGNFRKRGGQFCETTIAPDQSPGRSLILSGPMGSSSSSNFRRKERALTRMKPTG